MKSMDGTRDRSPRVGLIRSMLLAFALLAAACSQPPPPAPEPVEVAPEPVLYEHTVNYEGETLGLIARWYTGKSSNWRAIADANPGLRPERINLGDTIMIPQELISQDEPLPKSAVPRFTAGSTGTGADTPAGPAPVDGDAPAEAEITRGDRPDDADQLDQALEAALGERMEEAGPDDDLDETSAPVSDEDKERERLLDELLSE